MSLYVCVLAIAFRKERWVRLNSFDRFNPQLVFRTSVNLDLTTLVELVNVFYIFSMFLEVSAQLLRKMTARLNCVGICWHALKNPDQENLFSLVPLTLPCSV